MRILDTHLLVMLDVAVDRPLHAVSEETLRALESRRACGTEFQELIDKGSGWLFYGHRYADRHDRSQRLDVSYSQAGANVSGVRVAVQPSLGIGVLTVWRSLPGVTTLEEALIAKRAAADEDAQTDLQRLVETWGLDWDKTGRVTTLLVVQLESDDLSDVVTRYAGELGALFTSNMEDERSDLLLAHAANTNISGRRYERVYLRWTDALAVYDSTTDEALVASMRIARLVEAGLLMRRLLSETAFETESLSRELRSFVPPWLTQASRRAESLRQLLADAELTTSVAPPTHSIEGEKLLADTMDAFEVSGLLKIVNRSLAELDRRLEWRRIRWLAGAALIVFLANTALATIALFK